MVPGKVEKRVIVDKAERWRTIANLRPRAGQVADRLDDLLEFAKRDFYDAVTAEQSMDALMARIAAEIVGLRALERLEESIDHDE